MIKILISIIVTAVISSLSAFYFSSSYFRVVIQEQAEEERLQNVAFSQLLSEGIDKGDSQFLRKNVNSMLAASIIHAEPENSYIYMYAEACRIHQMIYEYRARYPEQYRPESQEDTMVQEVLEYWNGKNCGT